MALLSLLRGKDRPRHLLRDRRRARMALESLEERKVMSVTYGSFEGMDWKFDYNPTAGTGTLIFENNVGNDRIFFRDQESFDDDNSQVNGLEWVSQSGNDQGGVNFAPGTHVDIIVVTAPIYKNTFVNATSHSLSYAMVTQSPGSTRGTIDGMNYRFTYDPKNDFGTLEITSAPGDQTYTIQQQTNFYPAGGRRKSESNLVLVRSDGARFNGPMVTPLTRVNFVVKQEKAPNNRLRNDSSDPLYYQPNDRTITTALDFGQGPGVNLKYQERLLHNRGTWQNMRYDLVSSPATGEATLYWVNQRGTSRVNIRLQYDGNDGTQRVTGLEWSLQGGNDGGGVNFATPWQNLSKVRIVLVQKAGDNLIQNTSGLPMTTMTRR